jgi:hypothetical protein
VQANPENRVLTLAPIVLAILAKEGDHGYAILHRVREF